MNASLKSVPGTSHTKSGRPASVHPHGRAASSQDVVAHEGVLEMRDGMSLYHGGRLANVHIAWRIVGPANAPVVCALGGISANRRVCTTEDARQSWWGQVAGAGCALDSDRFRVLSFDYLGGSGDSTGPAEGEVFPSISSYDQAAVLAAVLDELGINSLRAIAGGSYGGMVALAFGERYPERVSQLLVIGAADRAHPMSTAWRSVQRRIVKFAVGCGKSKEGLQLARALAMSTYRSSEEFAARFGGAATQGENGFVFPVEDYLFARGADYATRYRPESFLCLSESIDLHRVDATRIFVPTAAVAIREDQLVPLADVRTMVARLPSGRLHEISSVYGHDAFLKECEQLRPIFHAAIGSPT
jgi:homoserine O-acetyltransferase